MRVLAIVPAFNEARNVGSVVEGLLATGRCDVCVVDDGSADATAEVARAAGARVLSCPVNLGIGGAVQTGYLWARQRGYDIAVQVDGDGQHDPRQLPAVLAPVLEGRADLCIGSRFLAGASAGWRSTPLRRAGIRYLSWLLRVRTGARVSDPTSGFRAAGPRAVELFARLYPSDYPEPESIAVASRAGLRIEEVPVSMSARAHGESSIGAARTLYYAGKVSLALCLLPRRRGVEPLGGAGEAR